MMICRVFFCAFLIIALLSAAMGVIYAEEDGEVMILEVQDGDSVYIYNMDEYTYDHDQSLMERFRSRRFTRLMKDVEKTMPYARLAAEKIEEVDSIMETINNRFEREAFLDSAEDRLMSDFEDELKQLNRRQGLLLIKLIDRETGDTTYHLIREYRSRWSAFFWQGFARVFGMNLKTEYDPDDEEEIEKAIKAVGYD